MSRFFAYHGPKNEKDFEFEFGYGFKSEGKLKKVSKGDFLYVIQKIKGDKHFRLCGRYLITEKYTENDHERKYRLRLEDNSKIKIPIIINENEWSKELPFKKGDKKSVFMNHFCRQGSTLESPLQTEVIDVFEKHINHTYGNEDIVFDDFSDASSDEDSFETEESVLKTDQDQLVKSRIGQGIFRENLERVEKCCRVTATSNFKHLIASHIKPWRDATDEERLDGNNGLLLAPHIDHLFDKGYITFSDRGDLIISNELDPSIISIWKISEKNCGKFNNKQMVYMEYHRKYIFKK